MENIQLNCSFMGAWLWAKLTKQERNIKTLTAFEAMISTGKEVTVFVEGCGRECDLYKI